MSSNVNAFIILHSFIHSFVHSFQHSTRDKSSTTSTFKFSPFPPPFPSLLLVLPPIPFSGPQHASVATKKQQSGKASPKKGLPQQSKATAESSRVAKPLEERAKGEKTSKGGMTEQVGEQATAGSGRSPAKEQEILRTGSHDETGGGSSA